MSSGYVILNKRLDAKVPRLGLKCKRAALAAVLAHRDIKIQSTLAPESATAFAQRAVSLRTYAANC